MNFFQHFEYTKSTFLEHNFSNFVKCCQDFSKLLKQIFKIFKLLNTLLNQHFFTFNHEI
jgi:hypothetical protein